eukprot:gnl/MRDRNA2_/MRDRNA2_105251_c0_seq1.p1 gnl/MRDRNA2_/MRDRNA2_105251_c0~~gnl/MRDRNA2_/MRDRNA2_105251_c0_seq1.p1  ORF type:complete len:119 (+),score=2.46 gnl/MRDRNA2_/MRDRNA2_105251_c0_seq1:67-423(+)
MLGSQISRLCLMIVCAFLALFLSGCANCLHDHKTMADCRAAGDCNWDTHSAGYCTDSGVSLDRQGFPPNGYCDNENEDTGGSCYDNGNCDAKKALQKNSSKPCCIGQCANKEGSKNKR